ncbi:MAG: class I SAM-dependent methyltransferase [Mycobacteriaceae bacterium]|nr:class I SAM-dependent methyltransferase [Mycobacteriaceae bacterium]
MLRRLRSAARQKLQRAVAEVVAAETARTRHHQRQLHTEDIAALDRITGRLDKLDDRLGAMGCRLDDLEFRTRRDMSYAQDVQAAGESAAFVLENMPKALVFWHPHDTLRFALGEIKGPGLALEFGVAGGTTLAIIADAVACDRSVVGFDIFTGLPATWRTGFPAGKFAQPVPPNDVPGATMVTGLFEDTLPAFLAETDEPIAFVHLDADLYSSTVTVLDLVGERLAPDAVLVLDEFFNYPGWQLHEFRAWHDFIARTGRRFEYLAYTGNNEQVVVRLH